MTTGLLAAFAFGVVVAAVACGVAFYVFVRRAGADWRRR